VLMWFGDDAQLEKKDGNIIEVSFGKGERQHVWVQISNVGDSRFLLIRAEITPNESSMSETLLKALGTKIGLTHIGDSVVGQEGCSLVVCQALGGAGVVLVRAVEKGPPKLSYLDCVRELKLDSEGDSFSRVCRRKSPLLFLLCQRSHT